MSQQSWFWCHRSTRCLFNQIFLLGSNLPISAFSQTVCAPLSCHLEGKSNAAGARCGHVETRLGSIEDVPVFSFTGMFQYCLFVFVLSDPNLTSRFHASCSYSWGGCFRIILSPCCGKWLGAKMRAALSSTTSFPLNYLIPAWGKSKLVSDIAFNQNSVVSFISVKSGHFVPTL